MTGNTTLIRVPTDVRDRVRSIAEVRDETFGQVIDYGLQLIAQEEFWTRVEKLQPDDRYTDEFAAWDADDLEQATA